MGIWVYMLLCADGRYYVGSYRGADPSLRASEHNAGVYPDAWTLHRRPVKLVWSQEFQRINGRHCSRATNEALAARQKGSRDPGRVVSVARACDGLLAQGD